MFGPETSWVCVYLSPKYVVNSFDMDIAYSIPAVRSSREDVLFDMLFVISKVMSEIAFFVSFEMWNILPICFSEENILNINFFHMNEIWCWLVTR